MPQTTPPPAEAKNLKNEYEIQIQKRPRTVLLHFNLNRLDRPFKSRRISSHFDRELEFLSGKQGFTHSCLRFYDEAHSLNRFGGRRAKAAGDYA